MSRELLPEQAAAAHEIAKHIAVTAGPGSGKTTVLVERYLHILRKHNLTIDQIVAITFTNRAANEMRERLRAELNKILHQAGEKERPKWLAYKRTLDGAIITTIHGFCVRLLREFPVEARVDPLFVLLDEHRTAMLLEGVVEEVLSEFISSGHPEISRLTLGVGRARLASSLADLYREIRGMGLTLESVAAATAASHATEEDLGPMLDSLDAAMSGLLSITRTTPAATKSLAGVIDAWPAVRRVLGTIPDVENLAAYFQAIDTFRELRPAARGNVADHVRLLDTFIWKKDKPGSVPQLSLDMFARVYALESINLLSRVDERFREEKQKLSALDFDDLEVRTLSLLSQPAVLARAAQRYRFFLVDEFQDTNALQKELLESLGLSRKKHGANLFIVGDQKQSVYGFRGADVDVFRSMTEALVQAGGEPLQLQLNFRSQPPLINFFNFLFARIFQKGDEDPAVTGNAEELGFVEHDVSVSKRELKHVGPLVEVLVSTRPVADELSRDRDLRELDAQQLALRITSFISEDPELKYSDIALLFRAMTQVHYYESAFRRAGIPYQTVLGRGFYEREEITDLVRLLRFLDNRTDELALAAVLRSPLCGVSDNALLALRAGPRLDHPDLETASLRPTRSLYKALGEHRQIAYIAEEEHDLLDRAATLIKRLVSRRHHYSIEELLRFAVEESEYRTVVAANFDGAQRLANVHRLFNLAARFEHSGNHLIRDFVRYVEDFEAIGSRESEGQIDEAADAVKLMTIHQAKGLEFPVVILPELQRPSRTPAESCFLLDRHRGLTLKVPDGRGRLVAGSAFSVFEKRQNLREQFEAMRLLYVAATRAEDRLILSGAVDDLERLNNRADSWLKLIWQSLGLGNVTDSGIVAVADDVQLQFTLNLKQQSLGASKPVEVQKDDETIGKSDLLTESFPLLEELSPDFRPGAHRFSVTQLINYQRCPRQYYFDRVLQLPAADELAVWNNAEAPEPPANLTAALKGAVIHRFCERYFSGEDPEECLRRSFDEVVRHRQAELADRLVEIDTSTAVRELLPLAENYLRSEVFSRVENAQALGVDLQAPIPAATPGLWSEVSFRLRRPLGILSGTIDKLLITSNERDELYVEIVDFKTNRLSAVKRQGSNLKAVVNSASKGAQSSQFAFEFDAVDDEASVAPDTTLDDAVRNTARDYQLQMQAYALAIRELMSQAQVASLRVTLHFLEPNVEFQLSPALLEPEACEKAIDEAMMDILAATEPIDFPVKPALHCRMCNFLRICTAGREFMKSIG